MSLPHAFGITPADGGMSCNMNRCLSSCRAWTSLLMLAVTFSMGAEEAVSEMEVVLTLGVNSFDDAVAQQLIVRMSSKQLGELLQRALDKVQVQQSVICTSSKQRSSPLSISA
jgi:hypothetical protein